MNRRAELKYKDPHGKAVKQLEREQIEKQTKEFLESGKEIQYIETGVSGEDTQPLTANQKYRLRAESKYDKNKKGDK